MRTPAANVRGVAGVGCRAVSSWPRSEGRLFVTLSGVQARRTRGEGGGADDSGAPRAGVRRPRPTRAPPRRPKRCRSFANAAGVPETPGCGRNAALRTAAFSPKASVAETPQAFRGLLQAFRTRCRPFRANPSPDTCRRDPLALPDSGPHRPVDSPPLDARFPARLSGNRPRKPHRVAANRPGPPCAHARTASLPGPRPARTARWHPCGRRSAPVAPSPGRPPGALPVPARPLRVPARPPGRPDAQRVPFPGREPAAS